MLTKESRFNLRAKLKQYQPLNAKIFREYNEYRPLGKKEIFCYVPFSGMTFCVNGDIFACSYNREALLGSYPKQTLKEIWFSDAAKKLRDHHSHNDLSHGCGYCKFFFDKKKFDDLKPTTYDQYMPDEISGLDYPKVLEFEISNICNLECQMCSGDNSSSIRKNRDKLPAIRNYYDDEYLEQLKEFIPHVREARFMGGEPFLIPLHFKIWDAMLELNPDIEFFIVTNGMQWNEEIEKLMGRGRFNISVSMDAIDKTKLERIRKNIVAEVAFANIEEYRKKCDAEGTNLSLSYTIQKDNWDELPAMINYCNGIGASLFISYLENPVKFSVSNLPIEELKQIRKQLSGHDFPASTDNERHNKHGYEAYLSFLDYLVENEFKSDYQENRSHKIIENAREQLVAKLNEHQPKLGSKPYDRSIADQKIEGLANHYNESDQAKIFSLLHVINANESYTLLNKLSVEELIVKCDEALENYAFE